MTREEAITVLQDKHDECKAFYDLAAHPEDAYPGAKEYMEALQMALAALRGPTREQVDALPKCDYCEAEWGTCDPITNRFTMPPRGGIRFCPMCGRPITDEAVDIMLKRLEVMKDENRTN